MFSPTQTASNSLKGFPDCRRNLYCSLRLQLRQPPAKVIAFLESYHRDAEKDINLGEKYYAEKVYFYAKGLTSRQDIMKERRETATLCPIRHYTINQDSVKVKELSQYVYNAEFKVSSFCGGRKKQSESVWLNNVTIDFSGRAPKITSVNGSKLN
jgi:hypothetical protein